MMLNGQDVFVGALLCTVGAIWLKGMRSGTKEFIQHKAAHHHIVMMNEEVARRWRESQINNQESH